MQNLYNISYDSFIFFLYSINNKYTNNVKIIKAIITDVLTNKESMFNNEWQKHLKQSNIDINVCKKIMMFIIASKAYILNHYEYQHKINISYCENTLKELENSDKNEIIDMFYRPTSTTDDIIEDFLTYTERPYIFKSKAKEAIIENNKLKNLLKINPLEILDIWDYIPDDKLIESEKYIQIFFDIYYKSLSDALENKDGKKENHETKDIYEYTLIVENIKEQFRNNETQMTLFLSYIMSNVYELLIIEKNKENSEFAKYFDLLPYFERCDIYELRNKFLNKSEFGLKIINIFIESNGNLEEFELEDKRDNFKKNGNITLLRRLNPYYDTEEFVYNRIKKTSRFN